MIAIIVILWQSGSVAYLRARWIKFCFWCIPAAGLLFFDHHAGSQTAIGTRQWGHADGTGDYRYFDPNFGCRIIFVDRIERCHVDRFCHLFFCGRCPCIRPYPPAKAYDMREATNQRFFRMRFSGGTIFAGCRAYLLS